LRFRPCEWRGCAHTARTATGKHALTEAWTTDLDEELSRRITIPKNHDTAAALDAIKKAISEGRVTELYAITYTQPGHLTGVPKKVPDLMEMRDRRRKP